MSRLEWVITMTIEPIVMIFELRSRSLSRDTSLLTLLIARVVPRYRARAVVCALLVLRTVPANVQIRMPALACAL